MTKLLWWNVRMVFIDERSRILQNMMKIQINRRKTMKINEIIREIRLAEGFTQEQMASYLGVSAPAVNKWEKGVSQS